jgi:membrane protein YqaA with SNARE-associated domain
MIEKNFTNLSTRGGHSGLAALKMTMRTYSMEKQLYSWNPMILLRRLYYWTLRWADHHHNTKFLALLSFCESIFFPIPPDVLLIAMGAGQPKRALRYAMITTAGSLLGALGGYFIGYLFWQITQDFFFTYLFSEEMFNLVVTKFQENTFLAIFVASFSPIPFKVFTVAAGVAHISLPLFLFSALLGRAMRFFIVGGLLYYYGASVRLLIERHFEKLTIAFTLLLVLGFAVLKLAI